MKEMHAVIGGAEMAVIYPELPLRPRAWSASLCSLAFSPKENEDKELKATYPPYFISKQKGSAIPLIWMLLLEEVKKKFAGTILQILTVED